MVYSGLPLHGFRTEKDNTFVQLNQLADLQTQLLNDFLKSHTALGDMKMYYQSEGMEWRAESWQRTQDYSLGIGSILFLFFALWIQTRSAWIAFFSLVGALGSFVWANLVYRIVLNFHSFADPQALAGYVAAFLGAFHTVYILHLFQQATQLTRLQTEEARLGTTMKTGHRVVITVTLVLALAFFVSAASSFVVVMNYAVFCGVLCFTSYLSAVLYLPSVIITWHLFWSRITVSSILNCNLTVLRATLTSNFGTDAAKDVQMSRGEIMGTDVIGAVKPTNRGRGHKVPLQRFFRGIYVDFFLAHPMLRWLLISASVIIVAAFLIAAAIRLHTDVNQVRDRRRTRKSKTQKLM